MKVAIYVRVSKTIQNPEIQKEMLVNYCGNNNIEVYKIYQDIITGKSDSRPAFNRLMSDMRARLFNCVAVYKLDRIGRSLQHLLQLFQEFKNSGITFISITQNINTSTPEGKLQLHMLMILAEYEREMIASRTKDTLNNYKDKIKQDGFFISREGKKVEHLGRPKGSKDKVQRRKSGYYRRWAGDK